MAEMFTLRIFPDGTVTIIAGDFLEVESEMEINDLIERLKTKGFRPVVKDAKLEFTGETHKHTHTHGLYEHQH